MVFQYVWSKKKKEVICILLKLEIPLETIKEKKKNSYNCNSYNRTGRIKHKIQ